MKWIVCFCESKNIGIWKLFTLGKPSFSHVFAVRYDKETDVWIKLEFGTERFHCSVFRGEQATPMIQALFDFCTCVEYETTDNAITMPRAMYCVSFIKHLVGLKGFWMVTPYQLYCELIKKGGKPIFVQSNTLKSHNLIESIAS